MKYFRFLTICALTFLPHPVEGTIFLLLNLYQLIFFSQRRDARDCDALILSTGLDTNADCNCYGFARQGLVLSCFNLEDTICLSPSNTTFCTEPGGIDYAAFTTDRRLFAFSTSPLIAEEVIEASIIAPNYNSTFEFSFLRGDGSPSSKQYMDCSAIVRSRMTNAFATAARCTSCAICENGLDFIYDCSNTNGTLTFSDITNTTVFVPGPKVESCFPVADIIPSK